MRKESIGLLLGTGLSLGLVGIGIYYQKQTLVKQLEKQAAFPWIYGENLAENDL